ncbi:DUF2783 domain-containing protein [Burkholderia sp. Ac-20345]|uniref:DUF2783 domain-containing protein n=1 Tax=Burkholderia sp. Ac-20345 TaxID=2703891 RepID=UPI00197B9B98|nr:DUF2783 domain-containing protein [Burkholderia sp. Ac-20345]MBN3778655.1 DUF2783 domain-containing protein [Burkholderia sp. Ac-20345]
MKLILDPNIAEVDAFYERLIDTHNGLTDAQSIRLNERLVNALRRRVADPETLAQADTIANRDTENAPMRDAKLILLLSNHIGDIAAIAAEMAEARIAESVLELGGTSHACATGREG